RELRENVKTERRNGQKLRENAKAERRNGENPRNKPESEKGREPQEQAGTKKRNESIGIHNVNRRLKAVYGEKYGIYLEAVQPKGLMVVLMAKAEEDAGKDRVSGCAEEGEEHEKGNVS
ncbi:MAG: two-component sensor histidine kinase, partial [Schaedlerella arabinosiphila]|nr:two-component sensor histidine kinase [Schaedlerella arabinosiphila]